MMVCVRGGGVGPCAGPAQWQQLLQGDRRATAEKVRWVADALHVPGGKRCLVGLA